MLLCAREEEFGTDPADADGLRTGIFCVDLNCVTDSQERSPSTRVLSVDVDYTVRRRDLGIIQKDEEEDQTKKTKVKLPSPSRRPLATRNRWRSVMTKHTLCVTVPDLFDHPKPSPDNR